MSWLYFFDAVCGGGSAASATVSQFCRLHTPANRGKHTQIQRHAHTHWRVQSVAGTVGCAGRPANECCAMKCISLMPTHSHSIALEYRPSLVCLLTLSPTLPLSLSLCLCTWTPCRRWRCRGRHLCGHAQKLTSARTRRISHTSQRGATRCGVDGITARVCTQMHSAAVLCVQFVAASCDANASADVGVADVVVKGKLQRYFIVCRE